MVLQDDAGEIKPMLVGTWQTVWVRQGDPQRPAEGDESIHLPFGFGEACDEVEAPLEYREIGPVASRG